MAKHSLRHQLLSWLLLPMFILIVVDSTILYQIAMHFQQQAFDRALQGTAVDISEIMRAEKNLSQSNYQLRPEVRTALLADQNDNMYYSIFDDHHRMIGGDKALMYTPPKNTGTNIYFSDGKIKGLRIRIASLTSSLNTPKGMQKLTIQVAETLNKRAELASQILVGIVVPQLLLLIAAAGLMWVGIQRGLLPLWALHSALSARSYRDLSPVKLDNNPEEVRKLVDSVNFLMKQLHNLIASQNQFVADAAHQLRTPLAGIQAQIELAQNESNINELQDSLAKIKTSTMRLVRLVNQLLILARNQPEVTHAVEFNPFNLTQLAQEVTTDMFPMADRKQIDLGFECVTEKVTLLGDPIRIKELLYNLIDNAIRYTPQGGQVTVIVEQQPDHIELCVEDNGIGIPLTEQEKVFERFYRAAGNQEEGSGLGLAIVKEIAEIHHATAVIGVPKNLQGIKVSVIFDI